MSSGEYLSGVLYATVILGSAGLAAWLVVARRGPESDPLARGLGWALLTALAVFVAHLVPGALGVLSREAVAVAALVILAIAWGVSRRLEAGVRADPPALPTAGDRRASGTVSRIAAWGSLTVVAVYLLALAAHYGDETLFHPDTTSFHLPNVIRWIQDGSLWQVDDWIPDRAPGNYPQTGDLFSLAAILPFGSDFLVRFTPYPFVLLTGLGVFAAARELGVPREPAVLVAAAALAAPVVSYTAYLGLADPVMLGAFACGGYFLLRHWRTADRFDLVLAGVGLGLSFGARWYAVPAVLAVLAVWTGASLAARRPLPAIARQGLTLVLLVALCGGFWLVRNWVSSGNPVFPVEVAPFGVEIFGAPADLVRERLGDSLSEFIFDFAAWRDYLWSPFLTVMTFTSIAFWAALVVALVRARRAVAGAERGRAMRAIALVAVAALIVAAYLITPYTGTGAEPGIPSDAWVNSRYVVPALLAAAVVCAWAIAGAGRARPVLEALIALAVLDAVRRGSELPGGVVGAPSVVAAVLVVAACFAAYRWGPALLAAGRRHRALGAAAAAVSVLALLAAGAAFEERFDSRRSQRLPEPHAFVLRNAPSGARIGLVGEGWGSYPLFGPRFGNDVAYVGPRVDEMLRSYETYDEFAAAIRRDRYDLVLAQDIATLDPGLVARQEDWLRSLGYEEVASGASLISSAQSRLYARGDSPLAEPPPGTIQ